MVLKRVFVGNLLQNYDVCLEELLSRFGKFGKCTEDGFEKHDTFAYINIEFEQEADFIKLKQSLNNVKFKGNMLKIDVAKPNWDVRWKLQHEQDLMEEPLVVKQKQEQEWKHFKKVENIKMSWKDRKEIIPGRNRVEKRTRYQLRNSTFRVNVDGSLKVYKLFQNKLWGYERDKTAKDLAYQYVNGKWWNNYNHIIDRLDYSRTRLSAHGKRAEPVATPATSNNTEQNGSENKDQEGKDIDLEEQMIQEEKSKNANILDQFLGEVNLDEPVNVVDSDEAEAFGFSDNERENEDGSYNNNNNYEQNNNDEYYNNQDSNYQDNYNNNDNNNKDYNNDDYNNKSNEQQNIPDEQQEESEEEFIPRFGAKPVIDDEAAGPVQGTVSNTETLRALFNPDTANESVHMNNTNDTGAFKLIQEDNDDIDQTKNVAEEADNVEEDSFPIATTLLAKTKHQNRLFFPHFESPFLVGQTQLSQIETASKNDIWANWEEQFWENRGVWMKEMKNKKRDVLRLKKKRQSKDNNIIMI